MTIEFLAKMLNPELYIVVVRGGKAEAKFRAKDAQGKTDELKDWSMNHGKCYIFLK